MNTFICKYLHALIKVFAGCVCVCDLLRISLQIVARYEVRLSHQHMCVAHLEPVCRYTNIVHTYICLSITYLKAAESARSLAQLRPRKCARFAVCVCFAHFRGGDRVQQVIARLNAEIHFKT